MAHSIELPLAVMDATWLTELRTAAVSAVATRANAERCAADIDGTACVDAETAVRDADIVVTVIFKALGRAVEDAVVHNGILSIETAIMQIWVDADACPTAIPSGL